MKKHDLEVSEVEHVIARHLENAAQGPILLHMPISVATALCEHQNIWNAINNALCGNMPTGKRQEVIGSALAIVADAAFCAGILEGMSMGDVPAGSTIVSKEWEDQFHRLSKAVEIMKDREIAAFPVTGEKDDKFWIACPVSDPLLLCNADTLPDAVDSVVATLDHPDEKEVATDAQDGRNSEREEDVADPGCAEGEARQQGG
jgi:hypothetical protein